jgi:predicted glycoside hydrolase/deacetylase ChbG (UPF0249 family)
VHAAGEHTRRSICIVVDDCGLHPGVCDAALQLVDLGRVHAIGCQVGGRAWADASSALRRLSASAVDLGLHLDLTERPLTLAPSALGRLMAASLLRRTDAHALRRELRAQLDAFESALGRGPAFVDGHQHVHQLPGVREVLLEELTRRYAGALPWLRSTRTGRAPSHPRASWRDAAKARVIAALGARGLGAAARRGGFAQNARLWGVYDFAGGEAAFLQRLDGWLAACGDGDLLMCHPGATRDAGDDLIDARVGEFRVLAGEAFGAVLRDRCIELAPLSRIVRGRLADTR